MQKRGLIIIGHSEEDRGARSPSTGLSEWDYNRDIAESLKKRAHEIGVELDTIYRDADGLHGLVRRINAEPRAYVVSLHANAYDTEATGSEVLHAGSSKGRQLAELVLGAALEAFGLHNRGAKHRDRDGRGGYLLYNVVAPCVIAEPFFIDNRTDELIAAHPEHKKRYINALADALAEYERII